MEQCLTTCVTAKCFEVSAMVTYLNKNGDKITLDDRNPNVIACKSVSGFLLKNSFFFISQVWEKVFLVFIVLDEFRFHK